MSPRFLALGPFVLASVVLCGCNGGTPRATDIPPSTSAASPTGLALGEYLVLTLQFDADAARISADLTEALPRVQDGARFVDAAVELERALSDIGGEAAVTLSEVTPPGEAEGYHDDLLRLLRDVERVADEMADALESEEPSAISAALLEFTSLLADLGRVGQQGQQLVIAALAADGDDPLNAYLISVSKARAEIATALADIGVQLETAADTEGAVAVLGDLIAALEDFEDQWQELSPPPEVEVLHDRQAELIANTIVVERSLLSGVRDQDDVALLEASEQLLEITVEGGRLAADWAELLIDVLSR